MGGIGLFWTIVFGAAALAQAYVIVLGVLIVAGII